VATGGLAIGTHQDREQPLYIGERPADAPQNEQRATKNRVGYRVSRWR
jgi:hypothetical protein